MINKIQKFLIERFSNIKLIYIFGSFDSEYFNKNSDIDIAIYLDNEEFIAKFKLWDISCDLQTSIPHYYCGFI